MSGVVLELFVSGIVEWCARQTIKCHVAIRQANAQFHIDGIVGVSNLDFLFYISSLLYCI
jgi:hypothetical protein